MPAYTLPVTLSSKSTVGIDISTASFAKLPYIFRDVSSLTSEVRHDHHVIIHDVIVLPKGNRFSGKRSMFFSHLQPLYDHVPCRTSWEAA